MPQLFMLLFLLVVAIARGVWWVLRKVSVATYRFVTSDIALSAKGPVRRPVALLVSGLRALALLLVLGGSGLLLTGFAPATPQLHDLKSAPVRSSSVQLRLPDVGAPVDVDVSGTISILADLSQVDVDDQVRDWAVFGTLSRLGISGDALAKAEARMAPVRLPYLDDVYVNQYGRGRRSIVDEDGTHVLLFTDSTDPAPKTTLARLADEVRMETGQEFATYHVFLTDPTKLQDGMVRVTRQPDITGADLFGKAYGYTEAVIEDLPSLTSWLKQVDDLTFVAAAPGKAARLGGRGFPGARERSVGLEELAVLYRAQHVDGTHAPLSDPDPGFSLDPRWVYPRLRRDLEALSRAPCATLAAFGSQALVQSPVVAAVFSRLRGQRLELEDDAFHKAEKAAFAEIARLTNVAEDPLLMAASEVPDFSAAECREIDAAVAEHLRGVTAGLMRLDSRLGTEPEEREEVAGGLENLVATSGSAVVQRWVVSMMKLLRVRDQQTCARYDGPASPTRSLRGTRVGMNLFYTDQIAKIWVTDHGRLAPLAGVPGFPSMLAQELDESWAKELAELSGTRLWFGLREEGMTTTGSQFLFGHLGARVFAAGHGEGYHAKEARPAENSRRVFSWFDRHFAQIAEYEPEFALQNQIMKWSAVARWLVTQDRLGFLDGNIPARRNLRFDTWRESEGRQLGLRYRTSLQLASPYEAATDTECFGLEVSRVYFTAGGWHYIEGGVSLAGREALTRVPNIASEEVASLRMTKGLAARSAGGPGTAQRVVHGLPSGGIATAETEGARLRWGGFDLETATVKSKAVRSGAQLSEGLEAGNETIGTLRAVDRPEAVHIDWLEGPLQQKARSRAVLGVGPTGPPDLGGIAGALINDDAAIGARALALHVADAPQAFLSARDDITRAAFAALKGDDSASARRLFDLVHAATGTPEQRIGQALCDLEDGLLGNARKGLSSAAAADVKESPTIERLVGRGLKPEEALELSKGAERPFHGGMLAMVSDTARGEPILRLNRPLGGTRVPQPTRASLHRAFGEKADPGFAIYIDDRFSLNRNDLYQQGESVVGNLMRDPEARWRQVDVDPDAYAPELLAFADLPKARRVPAPRHVMAGAGPLTLPSRIYVITRCNRSAPPGSSDACDSN